MPVNEFLNEIKLQFNNEIDLKKNADTKSQNIITISGVVTSIIFGSGVLLITRMKPEYDFFLHTLVLVALVLVLNLLAILLAVISARIQAYKYVMAHEDFFTTKGYTDEVIKNGKNFDQEEIKKYKTMDITQFNNELIDYYLEANKHNTEQNFRKIKNIQFSYYIFLAGISLVILILISVIYAVYTKQIILQ